jgi:hypothetical protein
MKISLVVQMSELIQLKRVVLQNLRGEIDISPVSRVLLALKKVRVPHQDIFLHI